MNANQIPNIIHLQFTNKLTGEKFRTASIGDQELEPKEKIKLGAFFDRVNARNLNTEVSLNKSFPGLELSEFKKELRLESYHKNGDKWGGVMGAFFDLCSVAHERDLEQSEWGYSVGAGGNVIEEENYWPELFLECSDEQIIKIGNFLCRLAAMLDKAGYSY